MYVSIHSRKSNNNIIIQLMHTFSSCSSLPSAGIIRLRSASQYDELVRKNMREGPLEKKSGDSGSLHLYLVFIDPPSTAA